MLRSFSERLFRKPRVRTSDNLQFSFSDDRADLEFDVETLEDRRMLAGNVSVVVKGGDLIVTGDHADNSITLRAISPSITEVRGTDGTLVNGGSYVYARNVTDDFRINMKSGDDRVEQAGSIALSIPDDFKFRGGLGNDILEIGGFHVGDDLRVATGEGDDDVRLGGLGFMTVGDDAKISAGQGSDTVVVGYLGSASIGDDMRVRLGSGDDVVVTFASNIQDDYYASGSSGDDIFYVVGSSFADRAKLSGGSGFDRTRQSDNSPFAWEFSIEGNLDSIVF